MAASPFSDISMKQRKRKHSDDIYLLTDDDGASSPKSSTPSVEDDRRAHHNELERKRRDHIKDHFMSLKDAIPLLEGEKSSRALILKRAVEYISMMQDRLNDHQKNIEQLRRKNENLEAKLKNRTEINHEVLVAPRVCVPSTSSPMNMLPTTTTITPMSTMHTMTTSAPFNSLSLPLLQEVGIRSTPQDIINLTQALFAQTVSSPQKQQSFNPMDVHQQLLSHSFQSSLQRHMISAVPF